MKHQIIHRHDYLDMIRDLLDTANGNLPQEEFKGLLISVRTLLEDYEERKES